MRDIQKHIGTRWDLQTRQIKVMATDDSTASKVFVKAVVERSRNELEKIDNGEIDPTSPENCDKDLFNLGEYIYISTEEYYEDDKNLSQFMISVSVNVLKAIGEIQLANIMNEQVSEVVSLQKLRSLVEEGQVYYLDSCIENVEKENDINRLLK